MTRTQQAMAAGVVVVALLAAGYAWRESRAPVPVVAPVLVAPPVTEAAPPPPAIKYPVEQAAAAGEGLPADVTLDHSDAAMRPALAAALPAHALPPFFHADRVVRNIVATVDALPREQVGLPVMPVDPVAGRFAVTPGDAPTMAPENAARYALYVATLKQVDMRTVASVYVHFYPLFQQAYQELGYPKGYFNDRLVQVIDQLLVTPEVTAPIALAQPKVLYTYADPALETPPAGQKMMLRMGPDNAAIVKAKLREFRAAIVHAPRP